MEKVFREGLKPKTFSCIQMQTGINISFHFLYIFVCIPLCGIWERVCLVVFLKQLFNKNQILCFLT